MRTKTLLSSAMAFSFLIGIANLNAMPKFSGNESGEDKSGNGKTPSVKPDGNPEKQQKSESSSYGWGAYFTNKYFAWTANPETEKKKFPELNPSDVLKYMNGDTTLADVKSISFRFTTGSSISAPDYYDGTAYVDDIDFGSYTVPFLGSDEGFSPHATYISLVKELSPHSFIREQFISENCDGEMTKGDLIKGADTKTRLIYIIHNIKTNRYLRIMLRREQ